jgi:hypothetical protein
MIFVVPSELREKTNNPRSKSSTLLKYLSDVDYKPLSELEVLTGADVMISPDGLPFPRNDKLILSHIKGGAKLIQIKFGHDLLASVADGRLNETLSRMLTTGAMPWQCLLLFVGTLECDSNGMATVDGQLSYGDQPMQWHQVQAALNFWTERGGSIDFPLPSGELTPSHFDIHQQHINRFVNGEDTKEHWPKIPVFYDEIEPTNPHLKEWKVAQKLIRVDDLRPLLCAIPGARIGPGRATAIWDYMVKNGYKQHLIGLYDFIDSGKLTEVSGIGKKTEDDIKWGLFATAEERKRSKR